MSHAQFQPNMDAAEHLAAHIPEAPVWIVPCLQGETPTRTAGSSIYPAVQNMLLAARALGLRATLTALYLNFEKEAEAAFGRPADWHTYASCQSGTRSVVSVRCGASLPAGCNIIPLLQRNVREGVQPFLNLSLVRFAPPVLAWDLAHARLPAPGSGRRVAAPCRSSV